MVNSITLRWLFNPFLLCLRLPDSTRWCERKIITLLIMLDISEVTHLHSYSPRKRHVSLRCRYLCRAWKQCHCGWRRSPSSAQLTFEIVSQVPNVWLSFASHSDGCGTESCRGRAFSPYLKSSAKSIDLCWTRTLCLHMCLSLVLPHSGRARKGRESGGQ